MTLKIKIKNFKLNFWLPNFAVGSIAMNCARRELAKSGFKLKKSRTLKRDIIRAIKRTKKELGPFELVNVATAAGLKTVIKI